MIDQAQKLRQLASTNAMKSTKPRIITITSGKGGVGKSNIVVNTSIIFAKAWEKGVAI